MVSASYTFHLRHVVGWGENLNVAFAEPQWGDILTHTRAHAYTRTRAHAHTRTRAHAHTRTRAHAHTQLELAVGVATVAAEVVTVRVTTRFASAPCAANR